MRIFSTCLLLSNLSNIGFQIYYISNICTKESHPAISTIICNPNRECPVPILLSTANSFVFSLLYEYTLDKHGSIFWFMYIYVNIYILFFTKHNTFTHNIVASNIFLSMLILMYYWSVLYGTYFYIFPIFSTGVIFSICHRVVKDIHKLEVPNIIREEAMFILLFLSFYSNIHHIRTSPEKITYM